MALDRSGLVLYNDTLRLRVTREAFAVLTLDLADQCDADFNEPVNFIGNILVNLLLNSSIKIEHKFDCYRKN